MHDADDESDRIEIHSLVPSHLTRIPFPMNPTSPPPFSPHAYFSPAHTTRHFTNSFTVTSSWHHSTQEYDYNAFKHEMADLRSEI